LELDIDESTYLGAKHTALRIIDDEDLGEV
jgi:hypothetical protein